MTARAGAIVVLVLGCLVTTWSVAVFVLLVRSPDSDWLNGVLYAGPPLVGGVVTAAVGVQMLRRNASRR